MVEESDRKDNVVPIPDIIGRKEGPEKEEKPEKEPEKASTLPQTDEKMPEKEPEPEPETVPETAEKITETPAKMPETPFRQRNMRHWFESNGWAWCPFTFTINPSLFVGYKEQLERTVMMLEEGHKLVLIIGPTGSGKTTMLKWIAGHSSGNFDTLYIGKPPKDPEDFVEIINERFKRPWYVRIFRPFISNIKNIYQIPEFLNKKFKNRRLIVMFDEAHEANLDVLEWLRVLSDQVDNMCVIASGLPVFDEKLADLETFRKRIAAKIELLSLTKEEMIEMLMKRIENVGGSGLEPFDMDVIDMLFERTGGFPREVLKVCDDLVNRAAALDKPRITQDLLMLDIREKPKAISLDLIERMTPMQKEIIETLGRKSSTPGDIANIIDLKKYKSRQHAVRSINNVLKGLMKDGFVERRRSEKAFVYQLSPKIKTLVVRS